jgi:Ca2+-transporting ATPase
VARAFGVEPRDGLSAPEAAQRLARYGINTIAKARREPWWEELLESLREPLQLLLIAVGVVYAVLGEPEDALTILVVILARLGRRGGH